MLPFPIDIPQLEKWVSFVKGFPQDFEILFRVANTHANVDLNAAAPLSLISDGLSAQEQCLDCNAAALPLAMLLLRQPSARRLQGWVNDTHPMGRC
jgi:hypothetical protein